MPTPTTCPYCSSPLQPCPLGTRCPGSHPGHPRPCTHCQWGLICPTHGWRWPAGHLSTPGRPRTGAIGLPTS